MNNTTGGLWRRDEKLKHSNYLEILAIRFGLRSFIKHKRRIQMRIYCDNTTAVMVIRNMGTSHSTDCNGMCKQIWEWCIGQNIWLSVCHIAGKLNIYADKA